MSIFLKLIGLIGYKGIAIVSLIGVLGAGYTGYSIRDYMCDAAEANAKVEILQKKIDKITEVMRKDVNFAFKDASDIDELQRNINALKIPTGTCFTKSESDGMRKTLWGQRKNR